MFGKRRKNNTQPQSDGMDFKNFFVFKELNIRRRYPVNFVLMGVLGDLCLSRINNEIFEYTETEQVKPLNKVFMCDTLPGPRINFKRFLKKLYDKCCGYRCLDLYFTKDFHREVKEIRKERPSITLDEILDKCCDEYLTNEGVKMLTERKGEIEILTKLGIFLVDNYERSGTSTDINALFSGLSDNYEDIDWIFYLGIQPENYQNVIDWIKEYFSKAPKGLISHPARIFILEKPLQDTAGKAGRLVKHIKKIEKNDKFPGSHFFAVDHYASKWTLSQLPVLKTIPNFEKFIDNVDEIIIELLEDIDIPFARMNYMAKTGLFFDMMTHILIPLQFLFSGKNVKYSAEKIFFGYYDGYDAQIEEWLKEQKKGVKVKPETYFSFRLDLKIVDEKSNIIKREVKVFIRSGKGMYSERKRVILKRRDGDKVGTFTIDIKEDKFEPNQDSGVSLPPQIRQAGAASKHIRGYARILHNVMEYLSSLQDDRNDNNTGSMEDGKSKNNPGEFSHVMELLSVENAAKIIECIEDIEKSMTNCNCPKGDDWRKKIEKMTKYEKGKELFLDNIEEREKERKEREKEREEMEKEWEERGKKRENESKDRKKDRKKEEKGEKEEKEDYFRYPFKIHRKNESST